MVAGLRQVADCAIRSVRCCVAIPPTAVAVPAARPLGVVGMIYEGRPVTVDALADRGSSLSQPISQTRAA